MPIIVRANLHYEAKQPCEFLLQIEATASPTQRCISSSFSMTPDPGSRLVDGQDGIGTRRWINETLVFKCQYDATFAIDRVAHSIQDFSAARVSQTPTEVTQYLLPSRYCHPEVFFDFLTAQFGNLSGTMNASVVIKVINVCLQLIDTSSFLKRVQMFFSLIERTRFSIYVFVEHRKSDEESNANEVFDCFDVLIVIDHGVNGFKFANFSEYFSKHAFLLFYGLFR